MIEDYRRERIEALLALPWVDPSTDAPLVAEYVLVEAQLHLVQAYTAEHGLVTVDRIGLVEAQPCQRLAVALRKQLISLADRLGLHPLARKKLAKKQTTPPPLRERLEDGDDD